MAIDSVYDDRYRNAMCFRQHTAFCAAFAAIHRIGAVFSPPRGALVIAPSIDSHDQSIPSRPSNASRPKRQNALNTSALATLGTADAPNCSYNPSSSVHCIPLTASTQYKQNCIHRRPVVHARVMATDWMRLTRRLQRFHLPSYIIWQTPMIVGFQHARESSPDHGH